MDERADWGRMRGRKRRYLATRDEEDVGARPHVTSAFREEEPPPPRGMRGGGVVQTPGRPASRVSVLDHKASVALDLVMRAPVRASFPCTCK